jgi:hypothetical protein
MPYLLLALFGFLLLVLFIGGILLHSTGQSERESDREIERLRMRD